MSLGMGARAAGVQGRPYAPCCYGGPSSCPLWTARVQVVVLFQPGKYWMRLSPVTAAVHHSWLALVAVVHRATHSRLPRRAHIPRYPP